MTDAVKCFTEDELTDYLWIKTSPFLTMESTLTWTEGLNLKIVLTNKISVLPRVRHYC